MKTSKIIATTGKEVIENLIKIKSNNMKTLANKQVIESSALFIDLSESIINKIDLFLTNTNLDKKQQFELMKLFNDIYREGYENCMID